MLLSWTLDTGALPYATLPSAPTCASTAESPTNHPVGPLPVPVPDPVPVPEPVPVPVPVPVPPPLGAGAVSFLQEAPPATSRSRRTSEVRICLVEGRSE